VLTPAQAAVFVRIALANVARPYPHKLDHLLTGPEDTLDHRRLHPAFYGSYDWHSAVHMHWLLARLGRLYPSAEIDSLLDRHLSRETMSAELAYLMGPAGRTVERPYGWAWVLKLQAELAGTRWEAAVAPLAREVAGRFERFIQAPYPVRAGTHGNTAFACLLALDYARAHKDVDLETSVEKAARRWYGADRDAPVAYEPSLDEFLSPALVEAALMKEVLPAAGFQAWLAKFLPEGIGRLGEPPSGFDRADAKQVHLDGLSLSRAWCLRRLGFAEAAERHLAAALPHLENDYVGTHWLASFALLALTEGGTGG
jgi:hypothetical protein